MSLLHYRIDFRGLSEDERNHLYDYLDKSSWTGLNHSDKIAVYDCFIDENDLESILKTVPSGLLHRIP